MVISAASAGMIAASIAFDVDTDPEKRKKEPNLYGFVPNARRGAAVTALMLISSLQVLGKAGGTALLYVTNPSWLLCYMGGDERFVPRIQASAARLPVPACVPPCLRVGRGRSDQDVPESYC